MEGFFAVFVGNEEEEGGPIRVEELNSTIVQKGVNLDEHGILHEPDHHVADQDTCLFDDDVGSLIDRLIKVKTVVLVD